MVHINLIGVPFNLKQKHVRCDLLGVKTVIFMIFLLQNTVLNARGWVICHISSNKYREKKELNHQNHVMV